MSAPMSARWQRWTIAAVAAFLIAGVVVVGHQSSRARRSADFTINYSAALLIRQGHPDAIYQRDQLGPLMLRLSDETIDPRLPFDAPLALALPWVPLTFLSLELAFRVWQLVTVCLLVSAMLLLARWLPLGRRSLPLAICGASPSSAPRTRSHPPGRSSVRANRVGCSCLVRCSLLAP